MRATVAVVLGVLGLLACRARIPKARHVHPMPRVAVAKARPPAAPAAPIEHHYVGDLLVARLEERSHEAMARARRDVLEQVHATVGPHADVVASGGALVAEAPGDVQGKIAAVLAALRTEGAARTRAESGLEAPPARPTSVRAHEVGDLLEALPQVELVGPEGTTRVSPEEALLAAVHEQLILRVGEVGPSLRLRGCTLIVRATPLLHDQVADVLESTRRQLSRRGSRG